MRHLFSCMRSLASQWSSLACKTAGKHSSCGTQQIYQGALEVTNLRYACRSGRPSYINGIFCHVLELATCCDLLPFGIMAAITVHATYLHAHASHVKCTVILPHYVLISQVLKAHSYAVHIPQ